MSDTLTVRCAGCDADVRITAPAPDGWEAVTEADPDLPGRVARVIAYRLTVRCPGCGHLTTFQREDPPQ